MAMTATSAIAATTVAATASGRTTSASASVQTAKAATTATVGSHSRPAAAFARSRTGPSVRSARKCAPWSANSSSVVSPPRIVYGRRRSRKSPA